MTTKLSGFWITKTHEWYVVNYMINDGTGEYLGKQFFDTLEGAQEFIDNEGDN